MDELSEEYPPPGPRQGRKVRVAASGSGVIAQVARGVVVLEPGVVPIG